MLTNEEVTARKLAKRDETGTVPEDKSDDEERERLRERVQSVRPDTRLVALPERALKRLGVEAKAVLLTRERCDCTDGASSLASKLGTLLVSLLVVLVPEHDNAGGCSWRR